MNCTLGHRERTADELMTALRLIYNALKLAPAEKGSVTHGLPENQRAALLRNLDEKFKMQQQVGGLILTLMRLANTS